MEDEYRQRWWADILGVPVDLADEIQEGEHPLIARVRARARGREFTTGDVQTWFGISPHAFGQLLKGGRSDMEVTNAKMQRIYQFK